MGRIAQSVARRLPKIPKAPNRPGRATRDTRSATNPRATCGVRIAARAHAHAARAVMKRVRKAVGDGRAGADVKAYWMAQGMRTCNDVVDHVMWHGDSSARRDMAKEIGKLVRDASGVNLREKHADELRGLPNNHYLVLACAELEEEHKELAHKEAKRAAAARKSGAGTSIETVPLLSLIQI